MASRLRRLLVPLRASAFAGGTAAMYAAWEARLALVPATERDAVRRRWVARYGRGMLTLYGVTVHTEGLQAEHGLVPGTDATGRGRLFVLDHRSGFDIGLVLAHLDARLLSRGDVADWPVFGRAARSVGTLFVDRTSARSGASVLRAMVKALQAGVGVAVFPEGTTFGGDEVRPFKPGAFLAAARAEAEIVPVGIAYGGEGAAFGEESFLSHLARVSAIPRTRVALVQGAPLRPPHGEPAQLAATARDVVQQLVRRARAIVRAHEGSGS